LDGLLWTPPLACGLLPGTRRARMLVEGSLQERPMAIEEVAKAPRVFLLNSVRGIWRVEVRRPEAI